MSDYVIVTDSTADLSKEMIEELNLRVVPLKFTIDGKTYANIPGGVDMDDKMFFSKLRAGSTSSTSQLNTTELVEMFESLLDGGKDVLYIGFSSGLSGTYQCSVMAKEELRGKYPERKLVVFDSLCASMGEGLLVYLAVQLKRDGKSIDEVYDWLQVTAPKMCHWFTVDDLHHLKRGGRVSAASALVGTMLGIKPVLHVDDEGHLIPMAKVRGRRQSLDAIVKKIEENGENLREQTIFISHGDCLADAKYVESQINERFHPKKIVINFIGPVIGAHAGPGTVALFFLGTQR